MQRITEFIFRPATQRSIGSSDPLPSHQEPLGVKISQLVDAEFGGFLWPSSHPLAWWIWIHAKAIHGKRILELGAGTALPGIVAAKAGASVIFTDHPEYTAVLENCKNSVKLNNLSCQVEPLEWGDLDSPLLTKMTSASAPEIILGADIFYNSKDFEDLFATIRFFMELNPSAIVWTTYENRSRHNVITFLLRKWGINAKVIELETFYPDEFRDKLHADVVLIELTRGEPET